MARRGVLFFIIWILCAAVAFGQSDDDAVWQEVLEQWAEQNDSETVPDDYLEQLQYFAESPINLNDTSSDLLQELLFLSDFQRASLKAYIAQNGPMASLAELYFVMVLIRWLLLCCVILSKPSLLRMKMLDCGRCSGTLAVG